MLRRDEKKMKMGKEQLSLDQAQEKIKKKQSLLGKEQKRVEFEFSSGIFSVIIGWNKEATGLRR